MDSYEYYLLYHVDRNKFIELFINDDQEMLNALNKLFKNGKIKEDRNVFYKKLLHLIENDNSSNFLLDEVLQQLITTELFMSSKEYLTRNEITLSSLRISKILVCYGLNNNYTGNEIKQLCEILMNFILKESILRHYAIGMLCQILKKDDLCKEFILSSIFDRSIKFNDSLSLQNLCYFFKHLCQNRIEVENLTFLEKYFDDDSTLAKKHGTYLIKCLLDHNLLSDENGGNWRKFIDIIEALEENQSHLILPSLELLHEMKIYGNFTTFWFKLCIMIINHENSLVKSYGLNYIFGLKEVNFNKQQLLKILEAVNVTYLFDSKDEIFIKKLQNFVKSNSSVLFELLIKINWFSLPFYYILESLQSLEVPREYNKDFYVCFEKQTEMIPKRIRNIKIRGIIKVFYTNILERLIAVIGIRDSLRILKNIYYISENHDSLEKCLNHIKEEDFSFIFTNEFDHEFLKYLLVKTHNGRTIAEIKDCVKHIKNNRKLVTEVIIEMKNLFDNYENISNILINDMIEDVWVQLTAENHEKIDDALNLLQISLSSSIEQIDSVIMDHITEIWTRIHMIYLQDKSFEYPFLKATLIILNYNPNFKFEKVENDCFKSTFSSKLLGLQTHCQTIIVKNQFRKNVASNVILIERIIDNIEILLDRSSSRCDIMDAYKIIETLVLNISNDIPENILDKLKYILIIFINTAFEITNFSIKFQKSFIELIWKSIENLCFNNFWMTCIEEVFQSAMDQTNENDKFMLVLAMYDFLNERHILSLNDNVTNYFKNCLIEAMFKVNIMTRDEQLENAVIYSFDEETKQKVNLRLSIAKVLLKLYGDEEFSKIVGRKILELSIISKKKVRYYPNSNIHRLKLHHFQPLFFCKNISQDIIDVLTFELLKVNNQLNVIYMLEIILAFHCPDIIQLLNGELNSQALKSIFAIAIMQIKMEKDFDQAERKLETIFKNVFPFSMGQNFGVRIYSLLTMILSYEHIKTLPNFKETPMTLKMLDIFNIILESVKQKNCLKYFNALKNDFRFSKDFINLNTVQVFYRDIPRATNMPFEEIIMDENEVFKHFFAADMLKEGDCIVMTDEFEILTERNANCGVVNLQRKYLPFKYQGPEEKLLRTLPDKFKNFDVNEACLKPQSDIIVVASLIDNNTNLGGLARTCEIFGISKYVIHSLKSQENFEFKTLSRTSEKWINITEIKNWQLFDYLIAMKQLGYTIAGAEQSSNSVSLVDVKIPKKCVLLLGNEKKGIPADLLGLLDLAIEIPQAGVVRSLNVHVAGGIMIWEYAKQHSFK